MAVRNYVDGAPLLTLTVAVNTTDVTLGVSSTSGYPTVPFILALERGTVNEEVVLCTAKTSNTFTVTRAFDSTTGKNHSIGAAIEHTTAAIDYNEANAHHNDASSDVHPQYVLESAFSAKGRSLVGTGSGTFASLAVGANDTVVVADSTQTTGQKWAQIGAASILDGTLSETEFTSSVIESLISKLGSNPANVDGRIYHNTTSHRWFGYEGGWKMMTYGAGLISWGTAAPSGGADGDLYFRY